MDNKQKTMNKQTPISFATRLVAAFVVGGWLLVFPLIPQESPPLAVIHVPDQEHGYVTIQQAIDDIAEGGTILVAAGVYKENLRIERSLRIQGDKGSEEASRIIGFVGGTPVISIHSDEEIQVAIRDVSVSESVVGSPESYWGDGITVQGRAKVLIQDVQISYNHRYGLHALDTTHVVLRSVQVSGNEGAGIVVADRAEMYIEGSDVIGNGWAGILVTGVARLDLTRSNVSENKEQGVLLWEQAEATLVGAGLSENGQTGLEVWDCAAVKLVESSVLSNEEHGVQIGEDSRCDVTKSSICSNNRAGVYAYDSVNVELTGCQISENQDTGFLVDDEARIALHDCTIFGNTHAGISMLGKSVVDIANSTLSDNEEGVEMRDHVRLTSSTSSISRNRRHGIDAWGEVHINLEDTVIAENKYSGIYVRGSVQAALNHSSILSNGTNGIFIVGNRAAQQTWLRLHVDGSTITDNGKDGIFIRERCGVLQVEHTQISGNGGYGVHAYSSECEDLVTAYWFVGHVLGGGNDISGIDEPNCNKAGDVCPNWLGVLEESISEELPGSIYVSAHPSGLSTIQEAIDSVAQGGTVVLCPGIYNGCLHLDKDICLRTMETGTAMIDGNGEGIPITISSCTVQIVGLTVTGGDDYEAVRVEGTGQLEVLDCRIRASLVGMVVADFAQAAINGTEILDNECGIELSGNTHLEIGNSSIERSGFDGVEILEDAQAFFDDCIIGSNGRQGLKLSDAAQAELTECTIEGNAGCGIIALDASQARGSANRIRGNGCALVGNVLPEMRIPLREASESRVIYPSSEYLTLQEAVDALRPGGVLELEDGEHEGGATIDRTLVLKARGDGAPVLRAPSCLMIVLSIIGEAEVSLDQVAIQGGDCGIVASGDTRVRMARCEIGGCSSAGVMFLAHARGTVTDSSFKNTYCCIALYSASQLQVMESTILSSAMGIYGTSNSHIVIKECTIRDNYRGIQLRDMSCANVITSVFAENNVGVLLADEASLNLSKCELIGNH